MVSFLFYAALLMAAAGAGPAMQRQASLAVGCLAAATALAGALYQLYARSALRNRNKSTGAGLYEALVDEALDSVDAAHQGTAFMHEVTRDNEACDSYKYESKVA